MSYFTNVSSELGVDLRILWNTAEICNQDQNGYIVQHMRITNPFDFIGNLSEYTEYFEAWLVKGGRIIFDSKHKEKFDDEWSPIPEYVILDFKDRILSVQNPCVTYYASVYWIPAGTEEFKDIQNWKAITTLPSNELPAAFAYKKDISKYHICDRHYTWDYKNNIIPYLEKKPNKNCLQSNS